MNDMRTRVNFKGRIIKNGYVMVRCENHPFAYNEGKYVPEQRLVMEKHLGRLLTKEEVVHHIDGNRVNNKLSNLKLMTNSKHVAHHNSKREPTEQYKLLRSELSKKFQRDPLGRFM